KYECKCLDNKHNKLFTQLPGQIWTWLVNVVTNIKTWGSNMLTEAKIGMSTVFDGIINTFTSLPDKMLEIGKNIVTGITKASKTNGITLLDGWEVYVIVLQQALRQNLTNILRLKYLRKLENLMYKD
ncbi:phage tail protein, partial [Clostridium saccharoperbutylacetonicum]|uniref:phage tail protein n=1 Tax=Clostridium saccharoperbutylacetonicum TaxID=36745 RepID=UPI003BF77EC2